MNYYFLLEDEKSLLKVLPHWLDHLGFKCSRVPDISFVKENIARYHFHYFHDLMLYKRMKYNKKKPDIVAKPEFFDGLCERIEKTDHISSFKYMIDFIKSEIGNEGL